VRIARLHVAGAAMWCEKADDAVYHLDGADFTDWSRGVAVQSSEPLRSLRPVSRRATVVCLLGAWRDRGDRQGPSFFVKPTSSLIDPFSSIVYPFEATKVVYEPELAIVIGRQCRRVSIADAQDAVFGYTCVNDVTALEMSVSTNAPFLPGKAFDTFGAVGPHIETDLCVPELGLRAYVNGELRTDARLADMLWTVEEIVSWVSRFMTLQPGDLISCGTPPNYGEIRVGDSVSVEIDGIGRLVNDVVAERAETP
jgi:5-oxopent-3-ene-1,2,5-tricarboxylate decarboxylase / 2-hydroxyhepta-2,4-diene-1,7-dioate isomerase